MNDKRVTITCDLDQAITVQQVLHEWLKSKALSGAYHSQIFTLVDEFDDLLYNAIWENEK